jgi:hypothetical protein
MERLAASLSSAPSRRRPPPTRRHSSRQVQACIDRSIDEVRLYRRTLSQAEIQADMNTPVGHPTT